MSRLIFFTIVLFFVAQTSSAQKASLARKYFSDGEFEKAAVLYKELHERNRANDYFFEKNDGGRIDRDAFLGFIKSSWESFPDGTITGIDTVGTGDHIVGEGRFDGTHLGDYMGVPATGKRVSWYFAEFFQFEGNKVKSMKVYSDSIAVVRQIGVVPIGYLAQ